MGKDFQAETDHKPLLQITEKSFEDLSPRLQCTTMKLLRHKIKPKYTPGKTCTLQIVCEEIYSKMNLKQNV